MESIHPENRIEIENLDPDTQVRVYPLFITIDE